MNRTPSIVLAAIVAPAVAGACLTSDRALERGKLHPDLGLVSLAQHTRGEAPIESACRGPDSHDTGREICLASNQDTVTVVDVPDNSSPGLIGRHGNRQRGYNHQGWLTAEQRYFVTDDELDENLFKPAGTRTLVFDVVGFNPAPPAAESIAGGLSIDHNQYLVGNYSLQANDRRGLRIFRIDAPARAGRTEVAFFDPFPASDGPGGSGARNIVPFSDNGIPPVSDIKRGLFVLRVTEPGMRAALGERSFEDGLEGH